MKLNPNLTTEIDEIICKAVETKPADRYASAAEMKYRLEEHLYRLNHPGEFNAAAKSETAKTGKLTVVHSSTQKAGEFTLAKASNLIGRFDSDRNASPDIDLVPYDTSGKISRRHAIITKEGGSYFFEDLGSSNGSLYNNEQVKAQERHQLKPGDQICIGETVLEFSLL
jgi:hypothetical protein